MFSRFWENVVCPCFSLKLAHGAAALVLSTGLALLLAAFAAPALAQAPPASPVYVPEVAQPGKDAVWVPTELVVVERMLDMARVTANDLFVDLGSGDGRMVITAARRGARAHGVEYNADLVELSRRNAGKAGVAGRACFAQGDIFDTDFSAASVVAMFLPTEIILKLRPRILALKPGTRIVSNTFGMGDWPADEKVVLPPDVGCAVSWCTALLWIVPARVAGTHRLPQGELVLEQRFQALSGTLKTEGRTLPIDGRVRGADISFVAGGREYLGRMSGTTLELR